MLTNKQKEALKTAYETMLRWQRYCGTIRDTHKAYLELANYLAVLMPEIIPEMPAFTAMLQTSNDNLTRLSELLDKINGKVRDKFRQFGILDDSDDPSKSNSRAN